ncbi:hypothetical protein [Nocardioides zeicaulis]|uniref:DUF1902 domain-containing protein n=1 Tax=Nocardioides zeicaulis TaxID=1776857 RepID=A0ABV6E1G9_9ACTN
MRHSSLDLWSGHLPVRPTIRPVSNYNHAYINDNGDVWIVPGEPGLEPQATITRVDGLTDEQAEKLIREFDSKIVHLIDEDPAVGELPTKRIS